MMPLSLFGRFIKNSGGGSFYEERYYNINYKFSQF